MDEDVQHTDAVRSPEPIERWWPRLSIAAKHRLLAALDDRLDAETSEEIEELSGAPAPTRLSPAEQAYIITQIEAVD